ncbi:hypothetical protein, partial [Burkholderia cepacia]|uniref:hypothetical protein n=2 Tax=Burkholderia cepacia TaxID=292 RepID=UPI002FE04BDA
CRPQCGRQGTFACLEKIMRGAGPRRADRRVMLLANTSSNRFVSSQSLRSALLGASASPLLA